MTEISSLKLYTDAFNLNALKILTVSEHCGHNVILEKPKRTEISGERNSRLTHLPLLEVNSKFEFFSSNAACRYLFQKSSRAIDNNVEKWLEWEASVFQPFLVEYYSSNKPELSNELKQRLHYLDLILAKNSFLSSGEEHGLVDMVIWSTLYPLFQIHTVADFAFTNVQSWFFNLLGQENFASAIDKVFGATQIESLKKLLSCNASNVPSGQQRFFLPVEVPGFSFEKVEKSATETPKEEGAKEYTFTEEEISKAYTSWLKGPEGLPLPRPKEPVILPKKGDRNVLITSALPYVNNVPHLGNIIGAVLSADVFARYCRLRGYNVLYVCGTDEYGTATETKAIELGVTPKEICDRFNKLHREIYEWFNISFDYFGRTTTSQQTKIAQDIFLKLHQRNLLIEETVEQLYCAQCQRFLADRFVEGTCPLCLYEDARGDQCDKCGKLINAPELKKPTCKVCKSTPHLKSSKHLFLDLPNLESKLKSYLDQSTMTGRWSNTAKVISYSWLKDGLKPRCITRDLKWGTPVPLKAFEDKVFYVWYDAPIGYLSITANYTDQWEKWWKQPDLVQLYQFMAKDNVPFHSIIFPACQLGTEDKYTMVNSLVATEYLNYEDVKFSKSRGVGVFGDDAKNTGIPSDVWRFYLLCLRPENQDTYFSWTDLMLRNNSELLNNLGNFINRALMFLANNFAGKIPEMVLGPDEKYLLAQINHELNTYISCMEKTKLRDATKPILNISRVGNQYIQAHKPWELIKQSPDQKAVAGTVLGLSANIACLLCTLMDPYMPETCESLREQLNSKPDIHVLAPEFVCLLPPGHQLGKPVPLFKKIDQDTINQLKSKYAGRQSPEKPLESEKAKKPTNGAVPAVNGINPAEIDEVTALMTDQGNRVRQLKAEKAPKSEIDKEVAQLLELKKKLALLKGENPEPPPKGKSKGKGKK